LCVKGILTTRYWVCLGGLSRKSSGYFWGRGGEGALATVEEDRQAVLRFSRAHRFLPLPIPHLFLRLKVSIPGVVGVLITKGGGTLCPRFPSNLCHHHPFSSKRATALAMLDVVIPTCRAISAIDNPNSSMPGVLRRALGRFGRAFQRTDSCPGHL
jgi:hypothetical protein